MKTKTKKILTVLRVLAWLGLVGYAINLGSQLISLGVSFWNPDASKQILGIPQSLFELYHYSFRYYVYTMSMIIFISALFLYLWLTVVLLLTNLNIQNPFTVEVSKKLERIAYCLLTIWLVGYIGEHYIDWLSKNMGTPLNIIKVANEFLFTAGIVYIISQIFKHGVEIQEENQQTI